MSGIMKGPLFGATVRYAGSLYRVDTGISFSDDFAIRSRFRYDHLNRTLSAGPEVTNELIESLVERKILWPIGPNYKRVAYLGIEAYQ